MKALKILLGLVLLASVGLNAYFWQQLGQQRAEAETARAAAADVEALRAENETLKKQIASRPSNAEGDARELARLRNEIGQLRKQSADTDAQRAQNAREVAQLKTQLATAAQNMEELKKGSAEVAKLTTEQMEQSRQRAQAVQCVNNLKQIGLAARLYANDHGNVFPPDFASMKNELVTPKILFCPSAPGGVQAADWTQFNPASASYQFLNPNGNESDPQKLLTMCPIHGTVGFSDGSVQMKR